MTSVLSEPVYKVQESSTLYHLYLEREQKRETLDTVLKKLITDYPEFDHGNLGIFSKTRMGIKIGSSAEVGYEEELKKEIADGYRIFKKKSKTLGLLGQLIGKEIEKFKEFDTNYRFELRTRYGINNVYATHFVSDQLYLSLKSEPVEHSGELNLIDYVDYLTKYIDSKPMSN